MALVERDLAMRELLRNAPQVFEVGCFLEEFSKKAANLKWEDLYTPEEVVLIQEGAQYKSFPLFLAFLLIVFQPQIEAGTLKKAKLLKNAERYWEQIEKNKV